MRSKPKRHEGGYYCWIADICRLGGVSAEAVISAARLHNHRVVGRAIWFRKSTSIPFADECLFIQKMIDAREKRRCPDIKTDNSTACAS